MMGNRAFKKTSENHIIETGPFVSNNHRVIGNPNADIIVIFLHGSGGGHNQLAEDLEHMLAPEFLQRYKFVFPAAKPRPYTLFAGGYLPVWFDRTSIAENCVEDMDGLVWTVTAVRDLARKLHEDGGKTIFIAGFSQGGCAALYCGYKFLGAFDDNEELFRGVVCMSSFLCDSALSKLPKDATGYPPLCYTANSDDRTVPERLSTNTLRSLVDCNSLEITQRLSCGKGGHWLNQDCIEEFSTFLTSHTS